MTGIRAAVFCLGALGSFALAGCGSGSGPFEEKIYTPDGQIREIRVDVQDREIEISPSGDGRVHLQYSENNKEYYDISVNEEQVLEVTGSQRRSGPIISGENLPLKIGKYGCRYRISR